MYSLKLSASFALVALLTVSAAFCQQKFVLSSSPHGESLNVTSSNATGGVGGLIDGPPASNSAPLALTHFQVNELIGSKGRSGSLLSNVDFTVQLQNTGKHPAIIPVQQRNLLKLLDACPEHKLSHFAMYLSGDIRPEFTSLDFDAYGCSAVPKSIVVVAPGEWILLRGTVKASSIDEKNNPRLIPSLGDELYTRTGGSFHVNHVRDIEIQPAPLPKLNRQPAINATPR